MWDQIHSVAEETELWTSLGINCWVILTGVILITKGVRRSHPIDLSSLLHSAKWAFIICIIFTVLAGLISNTAVIYEALFNAFH
jgi:hypothetical protein